MTLTPRIFLDSVVKPNADDVSKRHEDMRVAVNAMLTLDAFFGILYAELRSRKHPAVAGDDKYRDHLAGRFRDYRILRDAAAALKHGELIYKKRHQPRLVENVRQIQQAIPGAGVLMCGSRAKIKKAPRGRGF
jgi:hypothetical protein